MKSGSVKKECPICHGELIPKEDHVVFGLDGFSYILTTTWVCETCTSKEKL